MVKEACGFNTLSEICTTSTFKSWWEAKKTRRNRNVKNNSEREKAEWRSKIKTSSLKRSLQ